MRVARHAGSLRFRLLRRLALQSMAGLGVVCIAVYVVIFLTLDQRQDQTLSMKREAVQHLLQEGRGAHDLESVRHLLNDFLAGHDELTLSVADSTGHVFLPPQRRPGPDVKLERFTVPLTADLGGTGTASLAFDRSKDNELLVRLAWTLGIAAVGGALVLSAAAAFGVRRELAPLRALVRQTAAVRADRLELRLDGRDQVEELQPLIAQTNELLDRLAQAYRQMESFNADVAHELNNPLSILISSSEVALRRPRSPEELKETLRSNLEELRRIARIVADMLFLANAQRGAQASREEFTELSELCAEVLDYHEDSLREAGLRGVVRGHARASVDTGLLQLAISNLVGNAKRYATPGSDVVIEVEPRGSEVYVGVLNHGAEIPEEHLPRLFDRFYRVDPARTGASKNHGLGLSIVAAIARMHGGAASASSTDGVTRIGLTIASPLAGE
ncbi:heavy metal sensor histidine kinase [Roseateles chitinivorans]|uniref:heavy metal sensor histidine kinase n=1 Tax=Roseateles chitinivorans TaxID=2917965 RepID=UPI003D67B1CF